mgnify:CR=1 FL=1
MLKMLAVMTFEDITGDGRLWAVRYAGDPDNILAMTFEKWNDQDWLKDFFVVNSCDLSSYFKITNLNQAIYDTISDAQELECVILDSISSDKLDSLFKPLENLRASEVLLGKEKAKGARNFLLSEGACDMDGFYDLIQNKR